MSPFEFRRARPNDADAINDLYFAVKRIRRSAAMHHREWFEGPYGPAPSWIVIDRASGIVVAHHGLIPVPFQYRDRRILAGRTENSMVHPDWRRRVPYLAYEAKALADVREDEFAFLFTAAGGGGGHEKVRKRLGYRSLAAWDVAYTHASLGWYARRLSRNKLSFVSGLLGLLPRPSRRGWSLRETSPEEVESLWRQTIDPTRLTVAREAAYVLWRLFENPVQATWCRVIMLANQPQGFIAWTLIPEAHGMLMRIEDFFVVPGADAAACLRTAAQMAAQTHRDLPLRVVFNFLATDHPRRKELANAVVWPWRGLLQDSCVLVRGGEGISFVGAEVTWAACEGR